MPVRTPQALPLAPLVGLFAAIGAMAMCRGYAAEPITSNHVSARSWKHPITQSSEGLAIREFWVGTRYRVEMIHRTTSGQVEVHTTMNDLFIVQEGTAMAMLGGTVEGARETAPHEWRGGSIRGGRSEKLNVGDLLWIPAGEPHQVILKRADSFRYLVVKTAADQVSRGASAPVSAVEQIATDAFVEGPAVSENGDLYFSDLQNNRIWRLDTAGRLSVFRSPSNYSNGLAFDAENRLLAAENGDPTAGSPARITRTDLVSGSVEVLAAGFDGKALNAPNDLVIDGKHRIYFTDWARPDVMPAMPIVAHNPFAVYRIDPNKSVHQVLVAPEVQAPNGVMVSPDDNTLYLVESNRALGGRRQITAYTIREDGSLFGGRKFHDFSPGRSGDGMAVDSLGNLWVAAGLNAPRPGGETMDNKAGVYQFAPDGRLLSTTGIPEDLVTNVAFGGKGRRILYITAGKSIYRMTINADGTRR